MAAPKGNQYALGNNGGAPKRYTPEWMANEAEALREFIKKDDGYYIGTFAKRRGYHRRRIPEFVKASVEFALAYEEAQMWQEEKFIVKALTKEWDAPFAFKCMARVCGDEWKNSWDREEDKVELPPQIIQHVIRYADEPKTSDAKID
jgi:hypothetical protein